MNLPEELQQFVAHQIEFGVYESVDEAIIAGLTLLRSQQLASLKADLDEGLRQLENGESIRLPDEESRRAFFEQLKQGKRIAAPCPAGL
jgi:putative addiction module CopG family antidote